MLYRRFIILLASWMLFICIDLVIGIFFPFIRIIIVPSIAGVIAAGYYLIRGYTWQGVKSERSFSMLVMVGTFVLPMLTPFPITFLKNWLHVTIPTTAPEVQALTSHDVITIGIFLIVFFAISIAVGLFWNKDWWKFALAFWVPYTIFYTSIFTNSDGFFTGVVGSLGYWIAQQAVQRGSQPWYYYILIQIPIYEFLPFLGSILALIIGLYHRLVQIAPPAPVEEIQTSNSEEKQINKLPNSKNPVTSLTCLPCLFGGSLSALSPSVMQARRCRG